MEIFGKATINPVIFYSGKITGYFIWAGLFLSVINIELLPKNSFLFNNYLSYALLIPGSLISIISLFQLGRSTRFGLPTGKTRFKTFGLYRYSRNPMYLGFDLITLASIIYFLTIPVLIAGLYCMTVYHLIILGEEKYLEKAFGADYSDYKSKVRRYI